MYDLILVGNYPADGQTSMLRYADLLEQGSRAHLPTVVQLRPAVHLGRFVAGSAAAKKWLGYLDKYVVFAWRLRGEVARRRHQGRTVLVHVCDHGNSLYTRWLRSVPHVVTCHDLLAVQCALGEVPDQRTKWTGRRYQSMILRGLRRAQHVLCVSEHTRSELLRLGGSTPSRVSVIHNGLNGDFRPMVEAELEKRLHRLSVPRPYLLHVGDNTWYKNRPGLLEAYAEVRSVLKRPLGLVMAGKPLTTLMEAFVRQRGLGDQLRRIPGCAHDDLRALYSGAEALLFPSLAEGFGWPIIEAQACGCRVVTSNRPPMTEVGGEAAAYCDPASSSGVAQKVLEVLTESADRRSQRVSLGLTNSARFTADRMVRDYMRVYGRLAG